MPNLLVHDLRLSAVRNFDKNGVSQIVGMMISGHKTPTIYKRYRIVPENDISEALQKSNRPSSCKRKTDAFAQGCAKPAQFALFQCKGRFRRTIASTPCYC
jgi:hypothetical protein